MIWCEHVEKIKITHSPVASYFDFFQSFSVVSMNSHGAAVWQSLLCKHGPRRGGDQKMLIYQNNFSLWFSSSFGKIMRN